MAERLTKDLTQLIATELGKRHDLTSLLLGTPQAAMWTIGAGRQGVAAHQEVSVTEGTNTATQKRAFVDAAVACRRREMADMPQGNYVVIIGVAGTDWGYDGQTQADRAATVG